MAQPEAVSFLSQQLQKRVDALAACAKLLAQEPAEDAVHDFRVAIRRLEPLLVVFRSCFAPARRREALRQMAEAMSLAGNVRDCDVISEEIGKLHGKGRARLQQEIAKRRARAAGKLTAWIEAWSAAGLPEKWGENLLKPGAAVLEPASAATRTLPKLADEFLRAGDAAVARKASGRQLHRLRISAKQLRYTLEIFAGFYGPEAAKIIESVRQAQGLLGNINNLRAARKLVSKLGLDGRIRDALKAKQRKRTQRFLAFWRTAFAPDVRNWTELLRHPCAPLQTRRDSDMII
jgi:CHAD domain-containing protein